VPATTETVTITRDLPGRIDAIRVAEIRARVSGILLKEFEIPDKKCDLLH
jgi:membrane fusion protein (multidrug efflux system)